MSESSFEDNKATDEHNDTTSSTAILSELVGTDVVNLTSHIGGVVDWASNAYFGGGSNATTEQIPQRSQDDQNATIMGLRQNIIELNEKISDMEKESQEKISDVEKKSQDQMSAFKTKAVDKLKQMKSQLEAKTKEINELNERNAEQSSLIDSLKKELEAGSQVLPTTDHASPLQQQQEDRTKELTKELEAVNSLKDSLKEKNKELEIDISSLEKQLEKEREKSSTFQLQRDQNFTKVTELTDEVNILKSHNLTHDNPSLYI